MISNYDPNYADGVHTVRVTIQAWDYRGHIEVKIGGNCRGFGVMEDIAEDIWDTALDDPSEVTSDCHFEVLDENFYRAVLRNERGDILDCEGDQHDFEDMIVGVEIVAFEKKSSQGAGARDGKTP